MDFIYGLYIYVDFIYMDFRYIYKDLCAFVCLCLCLAMCVCGHTNKSLYGCLEVSLYAYKLVCVCVRE